MRCERSHEIESQEIEYIIDTVTGALNLNTAKHTVLVLSIYIELLTESSAIDIRPYSWSGGARWCRGRRVFFVLALKGSSSWALLVQIKGPSGEAQSVGFLDTSWQGNRKPREETERG